MLNPKSETSPKTIPTYKEKNMNTKTNAFAFTRMAGQAVATILLALVSLALAPRTAQAQTLPIDNFATGTGKMEGKSTTSFTSQTGTGILGGNRTIAITPNWFGTNKFSQPVQEQILAASKTTGTLLLSNGYSAFPRVDLVYGATAYNLNAPGLNLDMTPYPGGFNLNFAGLSNELVFVVTVWDNKGTWANVECYVASNGTGAFTLNAPTANFAGVGSVDWSDIETIEVSFLAGSIYGTPNLAVTKISAVSSPGTGVVTCTPAT